MRREKLGLVPIVAGAVLFCSGIGNHLYHKNRLERAKADVPEKVYELDKELGRLKENSNSSHEYGEVVKEILKSDKGEDLLKTIREVSLRAEQCNNSVTYSKLLTSSGAFIMGIGYLLRKDFHIEIKKIK